MASKNMKYFNFTTLSRFFLYPVIAWLAFDRYVLPKLFVFNPSKLQEIAKESIALYGDNSTNYNRTLLFNDLTTRLQAEYGGHVSDLYWDEWMLNTAGNAMGAMVLLHASFSEYLIIFGTPVGTEGHTGVHMADDYFTILSGEQTFFYPGHVEKLVFKPGDQNWMKRGSVAQFAFNGFALELAQGCIPCMMPFGLTEFIFSTLDWTNLYKTCYFTGRHMVTNLLRGKL